MTDLAMTTDGELILADNGDLKLAKGDEQRANEALFRLKTTKGDWTLSPNVGASLERFIGQPNTSSTHRTIEAVVGVEMERDGLLPISEVVCAATGENEVLIVLEFHSEESDGRIVQIAAGLDLREGLVFARTDYRES